MRDCLKDQKYFEYNWGTDKSEVDYEKNLSWQTLDSTKSI